MSDEMMNHRSLLENISDADLLGEMIGFAAEQVTKPEVTTRTGATVIATWTMAARTEVDPTVNTKPSGRTLAMSIMP